MHVLKGCSWLQDYFVRRRGDLMAVPAKSCTPSLLVA